MSDETKQLLAFAHPALMTLAIVLVLLALRSGLRLRRARRTGGTPPSTTRRALRERHLRLAKSAVAVALAGAVGGPLSMALLLDRTPFETLHGWVGLLTAALLLGTAVLGHRIEAGESREYDLHGALAIATSLAAATSAVAGFVLLP